MAKSQHNNNRDFASPSIECEKVELFLVCLSLQENIPNPKLSPFLYFFTKTNPAHSKCRKLPDFASRVIGCKLSPEPLSKHFN